MNRNAIIIATAALALVAVVFVPRAGAATIPALLSSKGTPGTPKSRALAVLSAMNANEFGGWFSMGGRTLRDVAAVWQIESGFDPTAVNMADSGGGAWGIGQVLATTAQDRGVGDPRAMLDLSTGARTSLLQLRWTWDFLASRLGRNPTKDEWIGAYNMGVGNVLKGRKPLAYLAKHKAALLTL